EVSRFFHLRDTVQSKGQELRFGLNLPGEKRELVSKIHESFDLLDQLFARSSPSFKWRLTSQILNSRDWKDELIPSFMNLKQALQRYVASLEAIESELKEEIKNKVEQTLADIAQSVENIKLTIQTIDTFFTGEDVRWAEKTPQGVTLSATKLDVSAF